MNTCTLSGRLTRDGELRNTQGGMTILSLGLAVDERKRNPQTGEWESSPMFFDLVVFGNRANAIAQYLTKGTLVSVQGHLRQSSWEKDGQRRSKVEVIVDEIEFMSRQQQGQQAPQQPAYQQAVQYQQPPQQAAQYQQPPQQQFYSNQAPMGYQQQVPQAELYDADIPFD